MLLLLPLHIDFETRSVVNLLKYGLDVYSKHPTTDAWCMGWAFGDEPVSMWTMGQPLPDRIRDHIKAGGRVIGHNVGFEFAIWNNIMRPRYGWPVLKLSQCDCTMARGFAMSLPGSLDKLAKALGVGAQKDMTGNALMKSMAKPRSFNEDGVTPIWWYYPEIHPVGSKEYDRFQRLCRYCAQDVVVERECDERMVALDDREREVWMLDQRINARGVGVDVQAVGVTLEMVARVKKDLDRQMKAATAGAITGISEATKILTWARDAGVDIDTLRKHELQQWLANDRLPLDVRAVLELRAEGAKSSVAKLEAMQKMSIVDGRARGLFQYHGASTGRWAGRAIQLQNLPRPEPDFSDPDWQDRLINSITSGIVDEEFIDAWYGPPMRVISSCVRGYLVAGPGNDLIGADLANIEGRVLSWLAGEEWKLQAFRDYDAGTGPNLYLITAARIYGGDARDYKKSDPEYLVGKVGDLALGFGGGKGAFLTMGANYGLKMGEDQAEDVKLKWRDAHPFTKEYWYALDKAAQRAVREPGSKQFCGPKGRQVCFRVAGSFLWLKLPSGRTLCYPYPALKEVMKPWGEMQMSVVYMGIDGRPGANKRWAEMSIYGGKWAENITQAVARDILVGGMLRLEAANYPIIMHVHDEAVSEVLKTFGSVEHYENLMASGEAWCPDLPVAAEGFRGKRYRK